MLESVLGHCRKARNDINQIPGFMRLAENLKTRQALMHLMKPNLWSMCLDWV